jgi:low affinity Fe/Cu permease
MLSTDLGIVWHCGTMQERHDFVLLEHTSEETNKTKQNKTKQNKNQKTKQTTAKVVVESVCEKLGSV